MKCPVCAWEHPALLCPRCGFDSSRDYAKFPTFGTVGKVPAASAQRKEWEEKQLPKEPQAPHEEFRDEDFREIFDDFSLFEPETRKKPLLTKAQKTAHRPPEPETPLDEFRDEDFREIFDDFESLFEPEVVEKPRKKRPWLAITFCVITLVASILLVWAKNGWMIPPNEPGNNVQAGHAASELPVLRPNVLSANITPSIYVYGTDVLKSSVKTVTFLDTLENAPADAVDVSANGDGSVMLWSVPNGYSYDLYYGANGGINGRDACHRMFDGYYNLKTIDFGGNFHTDEAQDMSYMFRGCEDLTALNLSSFDTANVQNMSGMFIDCVVLTKLDLSSFDTTNVTDMSWMFDSCTSLTELDLSSFDTANVQGISDMFSDCPAGADWQHLLH